MASGPTVLVLFTRIPVPGRAKTRLMGALGPQGCAELQRAMALNQVERLASLGLPVTVCYADDGCDVEAVEAFRAAVRAGAAGASVRFARQRGCSLGARMEAALRAELEAGAARVFLMGSDLPLATPQVVRCALEAFEGSDVLLCPSEDGGYWGIGLREELPALFETGGYGGPRVFEHAVAAVHAAGRTVAVGPRSRDLDTPADLAWLLGVVRARDARVGRRTERFLEQAAMPLPGLGETSAPCLRAVEGPARARAPDRGPGSSRP